MPSANWLKVYARQKERLWWGPSCNLLDHTNLIDWEDFLFTTNKYANSTLDIKKKKKKKHEATIAFFSLFFLMYMCISPFQIASWECDMPLEVYLLLQHVPVCVFNECLSYIFYFIWIFSIPNVKEDKWHWFTCAYGVNWFWFYRFSPLFLYILCIFFVFTFRVCNVVKHVYQLLPLVLRRISCNLIEDVCTKKSSYYTRRTILSMNGIKK